MTRIRLRAMLVMLVAGACVSAAKAGRENREAAEPRFQTSDRCIACHNGLTTPAGEDVSIGFDWRASIMANSSRDPYWQASVRRETIDHPESQAHIEDECSICHMPITRYEAKVRGRRVRFSPIYRSMTTRSWASKRLMAWIARCVIKSARKSSGRARASTGGSSWTRRRRKDAARIWPLRHRPRTQADHEYVHRRISANRRTEYIRKSEICATCHTLYHHRARPGRPTGWRIAEQVPYQEWLHSDYKDETEVPIVSHAGGEGTRSHHPRTGRASGRALPPHFRCGEFLHAAHAEPVSGMSWRSLLCRRSCRRRPREPSHFCKPGPRGLRLPICGVTPAKYKWIYG